LADDCGCWLIKSPHIRLRLGQLRGFGALFGSDSARRIRPSFLGAKFIIAIL
jgi:hypothetical protein